MVFLLIGTPSWYTAGVEHVPRHPRLQKRGSRYFLRVKVPTDLRWEIGKREIRKASVEADAVFETYRVRTAPNASDRVPASEADLERLVLQAFMPPNAKT